VSPGLLSVLVFASRTAGKRKGTTLRELVFGGATFDITSEEADAIMAGVAEAMRQHTGFGFKVGNALGDVWLYWTPGVAISISDGEG